MAKKTAVNGGSALAANRSARPAGRAGQLARINQETSSDGGPGGRAGRRAGPIRRPGRPARRWLAALAVGALTATGTAGCGLVRAPSSMSGMEKQIAKGEQVSAATQALATPPAIGPAADTVASGAPRRIPGSQVTAIGDSVMAASALALTDTLPGIYIDAKPDREMPAGLAILRRLADSQRLRPVVVIGLGTNYIVTTGQLDQVLRIIGPRRKLVLINTFVPDSWSKQVNATEAAFIAGHPGVVAADWYDTIKNRQYLLWPDHVHPEIPGTLVYARMVYRAVQATRDVSSELPGGLAGMTAAGRWPRVAPGR
jgi:hypothetical protein